jgi:hypothetical protein
MLFHGHRPKIRTADSACLDCAGNYHEIFYARKIEDAGWNECSTAGT